MRHCADIDMFTIDRSIEQSCVHRTPYCNAKCYNFKLYRIYPNMLGADPRLEREWAALTGPDLAAQLGRKHKSIARLRLMSRGEALKEHSDIDKVADLCAHVPDTLVWLPTRAWRDPLLRARIEVELMDLPNLCVLASLDPSNTGAEYDDLVASGFSTMTFGPEPPEWLPKHMICPKTAHTRKNPKGISGHCSTCKAGCFAPRTLNRRVDVYLREH